MLPLFVIIPTYRELANLPRLTGRLWSAQPTARLLLVDDASGDGTPEWVKRHEQFGRQLFLLERPGKLGLGSAYVAGFQWVLGQMRTDPVHVVVQMDADLSHDPLAITDLFAQIEEGADLVLATRYRNGVRVMNWPLERLILSLGAAQYVRWITRMPFTDPTGGFKAFRAAKLGELPWSAVRSDGYAFQIETTHLAWRQGWKIAEVPITFEDRHAGRSKMSMRIVREAIWRVPWMALHRRRSLPR